jgi:hypothetical protein
MERESFSGSDLACTDDTDELPKQMVDINESRLLFLVSPTLFPTG